MKLNILLLCNRPRAGNDANTIIDHIDAIHEYSSHRVFLLSNVGHISDKLDLNKFDVIIIHYSLCILNNTYLSKKAKKRLREYNGLKVIFIQDEYRQINHMMNQLNYLKIDVLFTCFPDEEIERIYPQEKLPGVTKYNNLTGYIPRRLITDIKQPLIKDRPLHVAYRGRCLPYWYGELAFEKSDIVDKWKKYVSPSDLNYDISYNEADRIYGGSWIDFISSCKATLGVESGASVMDFTGDLEKKVEFFQMLRPKAGFYAAQSKFLLEHEGKYKLNQISPRCFEAIALKTVLVLYEGDYSGILIPERHYIALKKDFSNICSVITRLKDNDYLQTMADITYNEIALNPDYTYERFMKKVDDIIEVEYVRRTKKSCESTYQLSDFNEVAAYKTLHTRAYQSLLAIYHQLPFKLRLTVKCVIRPSVGIKLMTKNISKIVTQFSRQAK